jgi:hypothetical protein
MRSPSVAGRLHLLNWRLALRSDVDGKALLPDSHRNSGATAGGLFGICRALSAPELNDVLAHAMRRYLNSCRHCGRIAESMLYQQLRPSQQPGFVHNLHHFTIVRVES